MDKLGIYSINLHNSDERNRLLDFLDGIVGTKIRRNVHFSSGDLDPSYDTERHPMGFDYVVCYKDDHFDWMRGSSVPNEFRMKSSSEDIRVLEFDERLKAEVGRHAEEITRIANEENWRDPEARRKYREAVFSLIGLMLTETASQEEKPVVFEILRAGEVAAQPIIQYYGEKTDVGKGNFKRLPMSSGENWVGIKDFYLPDITPDTVVIVPEIALASGSSIITLMYLLKEFGKKPKRIDVYSINSTQQGITALMAASQEFGIPLRVISATLAYRMNDHLYIMRDDGRYYVGDGGDFSQDPNLGYIGFR